MHTHTVHTHIHKKCNIRFDGYHDADYRHCCMTASVVYNPCLAVGKRLRDNHHTVHYVLAGNPSLHLSVYKKSHWNTRPNILDIIYLSVNLISFYCTHHHSKLCEMSATSSNDVMVSYIGVFNTTNYTKHHSGDDLPRQSLLLLVCVSLTIIGQPRNSVFICRV